MPLTPELSQEFQKYFTAWVRLEPRCHSNDFAVECLALRFLLACMDASIKDIEDVYGLDISIASFDKDGNSLQPRVFYGRLEDASFHINGVTARFPLFAIDIQRPDIKTLQLNLGGTVVVEKLCYKSALDVDQ